MSQEDRTVTKPDGTEVCFAPNLAEGQEVRFADSDPKVMDCLGVITRVWPYSRNVTIVSDGRTFVRRNDRVIPCPDMRGISVCWQNSGWHVYGAGPCFDRHEQAIKYRDSLDAEGVTWRAQR